MGKERADRPHHGGFRAWLYAFEKQGYAVYRVNATFQERVLDSYGPVKRKFAQAPKRVLDPRGILAPGKSEIAKSGLAGVGLSPPFDQGRVGWA